MKPFGRARTHPSGGTTVIAWLGSFMPGFSDLIAGSFQFLTLPRKMSATVVPSSLRPDFTPRRL